MEEQGKQGAFCSNQAQSQIVSVTKFLKSCLSGNRVLAGAKEIVMR